MGTLAGGWLMGRSWIVAEGLAAGNDEDFLEAKKSTASFYLSQILPRAGALEAAVTAGSAPLTGARF
jgi:3-(methylthio)propanoyl-CoA dehydrogenase